MSGVLRRVETFTLEIGTLILPARIAAQFVSMIPAASRWAARQRRWHAALRVSALLLFLKPEISYVGDPRLLVCRGL